MFVIDSLPVPSNLRPYDEECQLVDPQAYSPRVGAIVPLHIFSYSVSVIGRSAAQSKYAHN